MVVYESAYVFRRNLLKDFINRHFAYLNCFTSLIGPFRLACRAARLQVILKCLNHFLTARSPITECFNFTPCQRDKTIYRSSWDKVQRPTNAFRWSVIIVPPKGGGDSSTFLITHTSIYQWTLLSRTAYDPESRGKRSLQQPKGIVQGAHREVTLLTRGPAISSSQEQRPDLLRHTPAHAWLSFCINGVKITQYISLSKPMLLY